VVAHRSVKGSHPAALVHGAVGVAVEAGEDGAGRHHLAGLVPAVSVAEPGGVALTLLVEDGIQPGTRNRATPLVNAVVPITQCLICIFKRNISINLRFHDSLPVSGDEVLQLQQPVLTVLHHLLGVEMLHQTRQDPAAANRK